ncbi:MAG: hypothetical protein SOI46_07200, partial [Eggerthellaceae bacterium]
QLEVVLVVGREDMRRELVELFDFHGASLCGSMGLSAARARLLRGDCAVPGRLARGAAMAVKRFACGAEWSRLRPFRALCAATVGRYVGICPVFEIHVKVS